MRAEYDRGPDADQARTARYVRELLKNHTLLEPLRRASVPVLLTRAKGGIRAHALLAGGETIIEARIEEDRWWLPQRSGRALVIAEQLARVLRKQWDSRGQARDGSGE